MSQTNPSQPTMHMQPIGYVRSNDEQSHLEILEPYRPALEKLDKFSHVLVFWWSHQLDSDEYRAMLQCMPPYAGGEVVGIFACRAPYRPNPVSVTTCKLLSVDQERGHIPVEYMDADDGTPIVDLKAYFPISDRVRDVHVAGWARDWPQWLEEAHLFDF